MDFGIWILGYGSYDTVLGVKRLILTPFLKDIKYISFKTYINL